MSTVVDELVILIGLEGSEKVGRDIDATREKFSKLAGVSTGSLKGIESLGKGFAELSLYAKSLAHPFVVIAGLIMDVIGKMVDMTKKAYQLSKAFWEFSKSTHQVYQDTYNVAQQSGMTTKALQEFRYALTNLGGDSKSADADLQGLYQTMTDIMYGQYNVTLARLEISVLDSNYQLKSMDALLSEISAKFREMGIQKSLQFGKELGISPEMVRLLRMAADERGRLFSRAGQLGLIISDADIKRSVEANQVMNDFLQVIKMVGTSIVVTFAPTMKKINESFIKFINANKDMAKALALRELEKIANIFGKLFTALEKTGLLRTITDFLVLSIKMLDRIVENKAFQYMAIAIAGAVAAFKPFIDMLNFVMLILDDIFTWMEGGDSVFGRTINAMAKQIDGFFDNIEKRIKKIASMIENMMMLNPITAPGAIVGKGAKVMAGIGDSETSLVDLLSKVYKADPMSRMIINKIVPQGGSSVSDNRNININQTINVPNGAAAREAVRSINSELKTSILNGRTAPIYQ